MELNAHKSMEEVEAVIYMTLHILRVCLWLKIAFWASALRGSLAAAKLILSLQRCLLLSQVNSSVQSACFLNLQTMICTGIHAIYSKNINNNNNICFKRHSCIPLFLAVGNSGLISLCLWVFESQLLGLLLFARSVLIPTQTGILILYNTMLSESEPQIVAFPCTHKTFLHLLCLSTTLSAV